MREQVARLRSSTNGPLEFGDTLSYAISVRFSTAAQKRMGHSMLRGQR